MDMHQFLTNRAQFPPEDLAQYAGKHVAWSRDGARILAAEDDPEKLIAAVKALGCDMSETALSFVPLADEVILGGAGVGVWCERGSRS